MVRRPFTVENAIKQNKVLKLKAQENFYPSLIKVSVETEKKRRDNAYPSLEKIKFGN